MWWIGIDWAEDHHDACSMDDQGQIHREFKFPHTPEGFDQLRAYLENLSERKEYLAIGIERPDGLLVEFLVTHGYTIYPIPPKAVDRGRDRHSQSQAKDDRRDARTIGDLIRTDHARFHPLVPDSDAYRELRLLVYDRMALVKLRTQILQQLRAALLGYYPRVLELFPDLSAPLALAFLKTYPTPNDLAQASDQQLKQFLKEHRYPNIHKHKIPKLIQEALASQLTPNPGVMRAKSAYAQILADQLTFLNRNIATHEGVVASLFCSLPDAQLFQSLPVGGPKMLPALAAVLGGNRERFPEVELLYMHTGVVPITQVSGKSRHVHFRRACDHRARTIMRQWAFTSLKYCEWAKLLYRAKRKEGKKHELALRIVAHRWEKIIYAMWKHNNPYDETTFLASRANHQMRQVA
jgi:transposase